MQWCMLVYMYTSVRVRVREKLYLATKTYDILWHGTSSLLWQKYYNNNTSVLCTGHAYNACTDVCHEFLWSIMRVSWIQVLISGFLPSRRWEGSADSYWSTQGQPTNYTVIHRRGSLDTSKKLPICYCILHFGYIYVLVPNFIAIFAIVFFTTAALKWAFESNLFRKLLPDFVNFRNLLDTGEMSD